MFLTVLDIDSTVVFRNLVTKITAFDAINAVVVHLVVEVILVNAFAFTDSAVSTEAAIGQIVTAFVNCAVVDKHIDV